MIDCPWVVKRFTLCSPVPSVLKLLAFTRHELFQSTTIENPLDWGWRSASSAAVNVDLRTGL
jgi:hypothetical protein